MIIAGSLLIIILCVYALSVLTEDFFVPALDQISARLNLPASVAGASLMAMGSSAPELAIALFSLFRDGGEHADLGIGTIVGSAVFNILVITGASALVRPAEIKFRVVMRDASVYLAAIGLLLWSFRDGQIDIVEASTFLAAYLGYLLLLFFLKLETREEKHELVEAAAEAVAKGGVFGVLPTVLRKIIGDPEEHFIRAFVFSIVVVGAICWVLVDAAVAFSDAVGIPPVLVALTLIAGGTSVPDLISSIVASRQGRGDMAVANAVGSNIFDILIGCGLPWLIALVALGREVHVGVDGLWKSTVMLLGTVLLLAVFLFTGRKLSRIEGAILLAVYAAFCVYTFLQS